MGGASLGIENAGFKVIKGYDIFIDALLTHTYNLPNIKVDTTDITQLSIEDIPDVDYIHFSPPCQSYSSSGSKKGIDDLRGQLIYETVRIVKGKQPKVFTIENVKGLSTGKNKGVLDLLKNDFDSIGYKVYWKVLNAYNYRVVQNRERLFVVGVHKSIEKEYHFPEPIPNNKVLKDVISNVKNNEGFPNHSKSLVNKIKHVPQGGNVLDIPEDIRPKSFKNSYSRLKWDQIPPTITTNYKTPSSANCIHPEEHRGLSDKEALLIQGFDDNWKMFGKKRNVQIGNVVPPKMMECIARSIKDVLSD